MCCDYRNTKYCPSMENLKQKKDSIVEDIKRAHPRAQNMHTYISRNDEPYKNNFIDAYNGKCAYCGVSIKIIPKRMFEIDHFIYERAEIFHGSKAAAGYIKNLVLSCQMCNRLKNSLEISNEMYGDLHPDFKGITNIFIRDENYYIKISENKKDNDKVKEFYYHLKFDSEIHRLDYLLMNMKGLQNKMKDRTNVYNKLGQAIVQLQDKRNEMG